MGEGHIQRGGHSFVGNIGNDQAEMHPIDPKHVIEIATNLTGRLVAGSKRVTRHLEKNARRHTLAGQGEFMFHTRFLRQFGLCRFQLGDLGTQVGEQCGDTRKALQSVATTVATREGNPISHAESKMRKMMPRPPDNKPS